MDSIPTISIVIPVRDGSHYLEQTLPALRSEASAAELIVVDDYSNDDSAAVAEEFADKVMHLDKHSGAAAARNEGVRSSSGDIVIFVDADVLVTPGSIDALRISLESSSAAAVFCSYDTSPPEPNFASQYANLRHHYFHQIADGDCQSFWAGFGAVRRDAFEEAGGFDTGFEGIEDVAFGYRLRALGYRVRCEPSIQVTHLKHWTLWNLIKTDIVYRALPWSRLRFSNSIGDSLNLGHAEKLRAVISAIFLLTLLFTVYNNEIPLLLPVITALVVASNAKLGWFFLDNRGLLFATKAIGFHQIYYAYCGSVFCLTGALYLGRNVRSMFFNDRLIRNVKKLF